MPSVFDLFQGICLPIFLVISAGWFLDRKFGFDLRTLVRLNLYYFVPCFIFVKVITSSMSGALALRVVAFTLSVIAFMGGLSWAYARVRRLPGGSRGALQLSTMFYNCGNYGIPLMALAFPSTGPSIQVFVLMTMNVSTFSLGTLLALGNGGSAGGGTAVRALLRQPPLYAISLAWLLKACHLDAAVQASFVWNPLVYSEQALVGFALITLGVQLSQTKPPPFHRDLIWALAQRLLGGPLVALALVQLYGFSWDIAAVLILGAGAPTAINTALLAHEFNADAPFATSVVFYSTLLSLLTVTALLYCLRLSGASA